MGVLCLFLQGIPYVTEKSWGWDFLYPVGALLLLCWIYYDVLYLHWFPRIFISRQKKNIASCSEKKVEKIVDSYLSELPFQKFSAKLRQLPYFQGLKRYIKKQLLPGGKYRQELQPIFISYQQRVAQLLFSDTFPPKCKEDLELVDYKLAHQDREIDIVLHHLNKEIHSLLIRDLEPIIRNIISDHHKAVHHVRKSILEDQDALPVLGMKIPLKEAAQVIGNSGLDFDTTDIAPKSLATIAEAGDSRLWEVFCQLIVKGADGKTNKLLQIYSYEAEKGENIPREFLEYMSDWLEQKRPMGMTASDLRYIREYMSKIGGYRDSQRLSTKRIQHHDKQARNMLEQLIVKYIPSQDIALQYLGIVPQSQPSLDKIRTQIGIKRKALNQKLGSVPKEKRKKILVEIHFLTHELQSYLLKREANRV